MKKIILLFMLTFSLVNAQNKSAVFGGANSVNFFEDDSDTSGSALRISGNHSFEFWVKGGSVERGNVFAINNNSSSARGCFRAEKLANSGALRVVFGQVQTSGFPAYFGDDTATTVFDNAWHHVAIVGTTSAGVTTVNVYIDGVVDANFAGTSVTYTRPLAGTWTQNGINGPGRASNVSIGTRFTSTNANQTFDGEIDEVRIWTKALTPTEISDNSCIELPLSTTDLHRYIKFNDNFTELIAGKTVNETGTVTYTNASNCVTASTKNNILSSTLEIYPNPVNDILNIKSKADIRSLEIIDLLGKRVFKSNDKLDRINVRDFAKGVYLLKITSKSNVNVTKRIVIN